MSEYDRLWREINGLKKNVRGLSQPQLAFSTVEDGYVTWRDAHGNVRLRVGLQEDGTQSVLHMNGPKPPTPSAPTVTVDGVVITVDHDGSNVDGVPLSTDYRRRIVYAGFSSDMSDAMPVATIEPPTGGQAVFMSPGNGTVYVAVRVETHATMLSDFSQAVPVEVTMISLEGEFEIVKDSANGKNKNFYSPEPPKEGSEGDVWFDTSIDPDTGKPKWGLNLWDGSKWVSARDSRLQVVETAQAELAKKLDAVVVSADGGNKNFYSPTAPTKDMKPGDLWFDGSKGNMPHRFDGSKWVSVADQRVQAVEKAQEALKADLSTVKATADGKNQSFYQPTTPTGTPAKGDLWFDTSKDGKNRVSVWDGKAWVDASDKRVADLQAGQDALSGDLAGVRASVDGKTSIRWEASVPTPATPGGVAGDTWHQYKDGKHVGTWRWDGSKWVQSVFDPVMIPLLDIGTGTFGELDGARIKADSVQAGKVLVKGSVGSTLIADGAITTEKIATGAITAESGVIGSLDAGTIKSGFLDSARIQAGSIRADQMQVSTDDNWVSTVLLANGITAPHRSLNGSTVEAITGSAYGPSLRVKRGANISSLAIRAPEGSSGSVLGGTMFPVQVGTRMVLRARLYRSGSYTNNVAPSVRSIAYHYKPDGSYLSQDNLPAWVKPMSYSGETTDILHHEWVIPQGAAWMQIYIQLDSDTGWVVLGDPVLKPMVGATVIEPGAITTEKIATGAITAESGVIGSLDLGKATVGELDGSRIKASTVTADKVLIGNGGNLIPNGDGLTTSNAGFTGIDFDVKEKALVMPSNGTRLSSATFRVEPGEYELSADIKGPNGSHVYVGIMDYKTRWAYGIANVTITGAWKTYTSTVVVNQARSEQPQVVRILPGYNDKLPASEKTWIRNISLRKKVGSTVIADGAITTEKIATGAITAESGVIGSLDAGKITVGEMDGARIKANTIGADLLKAGAVTATILDATAIDGKTITGATIQTSRDHPKSFMDTAGFHVTDGDGMDQITLGQAGGDLLSIRDAEGTPMATVSNLGEISGAGLNIDSDPVFNGLPLIGQSQEVLAPTSAVELSAWFDALPRGVIAHGREDNQSGWEIKSGGGEMALLEVQADLKANRMYKITLSPIMVKNAGGSWVDVFVKYDWKGGRPTFDSTAMRKFSATSWKEGEILQFGGSWMYSPGSDEDTRFLLSVRAGKQARIHDAGQGISEMIIEDVGPFVDNVSVRRGDNDSVPAETPSAPKPKPPPPPPQKKNHTKKYWANGGRTFYTRGGWRSQNRDKCYQGSMPGMGGVQSIATFPSMTGDLSGATITAMTAYVYMEHFYYGSGGVVKLIGHNRLSSDITKIPDGWKLLKTSNRIGRNSGVQIPIPREYWNDFKTGKLKGIGLGDSSPSTSEYGYGPWKRMWIEVKYRK